jgi:NAD(P)-dependent dehydrogenase (short-subunit alcohol dehydrogenase family)
MCDATDPARVEAAVASVVDALGGIDILIHAAGVQSRIPFLKLSFDEWRRVLATNLDGAFAVGQAVARRMVDAGSGGAMVFVSSVAQEGVAPNMTHYAVSKAGLLSLVRMMAYELAPHRVRVNALAPGLTETDINRADLADQGFREMRMSRIPLGFIGEPDDQVGAALFLVSPEARYVTGSCVTVDGGSSMLGPASLYPG